VSTALVLSAETPSACAVVRGLHGAGFEVAVVAESTLSPASLSWKCHRRHVLDGWTGPLIAGLIEQEKPSVVVPVTESDLVRLAPVRARVEQLAPVVAPSPTVLSLAMDKVEGIAAAASAGVAVPHQWVLGPDDPTDIPADEFPLVAKPQFSRVRLDDGSVWGGTAAYVPDLTALDGLRNEHVMARFATVVQRPVPGTAMGVALLLRDNGAPALTFVHRRIRELRPEGGPSACAVSAAPRADLVDAAVSAARALGLIGVPVQFEFRVPDEGPPVLLDVNPRPWGTLGLALDAGVDFYGVAARSALGERLPLSPPDYAVGLQRHFLAFELRRACAVLFGRPNPGYRGPWPRKRDALFDWLFLPDQGMVGKLDDPLPAVGYALRMAWKALNG
jgi:ATP-grasp domain-containing protein